MANFNGQFQYTTTDGHVAQQGECRIEFDTEKLALTPRTGVPIVFDFGDLDGVIAEDHQIRLPIYTGNTVLLHQLGKAYERLAKELLDAHRDRAVECLLLEDLEEIDRFSGAFEVLTAGPRCRKCAAHARPGARFCPECGAGIEAAVEAIDSVCPSCGTRGTGKFCTVCGTVMRPHRPSKPQCGEAELRLYESNLAVLPTSSQGFQLRLADIDEIKFSGDGYEVVIETGDQCLKLNQLGHRTEEFAEKLQAGVSDVTSRGAKAVHLALPFLTPDQLQAASNLLREGRSVPMAKLNKIDRRIASSLATNAVDAELKPYYEDLLKRTAKDAVYAGFKFVRGEADEYVAATESVSEDSEEQDEAGYVSEDVDDPGDSDEQGRQNLYWFFFPLTNATGKLINVVAWEASSKGGRATYFFRLLEPERASQLGDAAAVDSAIAKLSRALGILNFRRRPIYLSNDELETSPRFRRYAIANRRIAELRQIRASFIGRAMHKSLETWQAQVDSILKGR